MSHYLSPEDLLSHATWMRGLARSLVLDEMRAEDVVQEAFALVAERRPARPKSLGGWLRGMVHNLALRGRREDVRRRRREAIAALPESCAPSQAEVLERAELQRAVVDSVLDLPEPYRGTILARYFNEIEAADIAKRDGVPLATVRTRLQRGLERLRRALDARHGGGRDLWLAVLLPLAGVSLATGAAGAGASAQCATTVGAGVLPGAAGAAAASTTNKLLILGGALMAQKTITVAAAATLLSLAVGLGLGRYTARATSESASQVVQLAHASKVRDLESRLEQAAQRAAAETERAKAEVAELTARLESLDAALKTARAEAAAAPMPKPPAALAVSFGKFADLPELRDADWQELAGALKEANRLSLESIEKLEKGERLDDKLTAEIAGHYSKLSKFTLDLMGKIPTNAAFNGAFTHPLVTSNLIGAMLEAAGLPLSAAQSAAMARLGNDYERQYGEKQEGYSDVTPVMTKMLDEFELKYSCLQNVRSQLTAEQREEVLSPELQDRLQHDLLSPGAAAFFSVKPKPYPSAEAAREQFQKSFLADLGLTVEQNTVQQNAALQAAFDAWYEDVKPLLAPQKPTPLSPPLDAVFQAGRAQERLLLRILELPDLDAKIRRSLLENGQWTLPQVFEKE